MTVTVDQLRNLTDRAAHGLTPDEQQRLRDGIDQLAQLRTAPPADNSPDNPDNLHARITAAIRDSPARYPDDIATAVMRVIPADVRHVTALYERWVKAGPPPLGTSMSRWWDKRLVELHAALNPKEN